MGKTNPYQTKPQQDITCMKHVYNTVLYVDAVSYNFHDTMCNMGNGYTFHR